MGNFDFALIGGPRDGGSVHVRAIDQYPELWFEPSGSGSYAGSSLYVCPPPVGAAGPRAKYAFSQGRYEFQGLDFPPVAQGR